MRGVASLFALGGEDARRLATFHAGFSALPRNSTCLALSFEKLSDHGCPWLIRSLRRAQRRTMPCWSTATRICAPFQLRGSSNCFCQRSNASDDSLGFEKVGGTTPCRFITPKAFGDKKARKRRPCVKTETVAACLLAFIRVHSRCPD